MMKEANLLDVYWRESIHTIVYILNRSQERLNSSNTPYELWYGKPSSVKYFRFFGRKFYIRRDEDNLGNFDARSYEGIFLGYSIISKEYQCYNKRLKMIFESASVKVGEEPHQSSVLIEGYESNESPCSEEGKAKEKGKELTLEEEEALEKNPKTPKYV